MPQQAQIKELCAPIAADVVTGVNVRKPQVGQLPDQMVSLSRRVSGLFVECLTGIVRKSLARAATFSRAARMLASALSPHVFSTANARTSCTPMKWSQNST